MKTAPLSPANTFDIIILIRNAFHTKYRFLHNKGRDFMNINQIIKEKRKDLSLTQEQLANQLGVSTPAVSKWESGGSLR